MTTKNINTAARSFLQDLYIVQQTDGIRHDLSMHYGASSPTLIHPVHSIANVKAPRTTSALKQDIRLDTCLEVAENDHEEAQLQLQAHENRTEQNQQISSQSYRKAALIGFFIGMLFSSAALAVVLSLWLVRSG